MQIVVGTLARDTGEVVRPARLGYCPQLPLLWDKLKVAEHFALFATAYRMQDDRASATEIFLARQLIVVLSKRRDLEIGF